MVLAFTINASAQVMPHVRIPTPEETKMINRTTGWHATAVTSSIASAGFAAMAGIYKIEMSEAEFRNKYNTDKVIVSMALVLSATSAFVATVSWGEYVKHKHRLSENTLWLKTTPTGLIIEF